MSINEKAIVSPGPGNYDTNIGLYEQIKNRQAIARQIQQRIPAARQPSFIGTKSSLNGRSV